MWNAQFSAHVYCDQTAARIKMPLGTKVGLGPDDIVLDGTQLPLPKKGRSPLSIFGPFLLWPSASIDQDGTWPGDWPWSRDSTWYGGRPRPRRHCARWVPTSHPPKGGRAPNFRPFYCGQTAGCIKMPLSVEVGFSPGDFVLDANPARLPKKGRSPQFSAHVYCGQTAAWTKMPLGTEVGLGLRDIVLDGDPAHPPIKGHTPNFQSMPVVAKRLWMD